MPAKTDGPFHFFCLKDTGEHDFDILKVNGMRGAEGKHFNLLKQQDCLERASELHASLWN